MDLPATQAVDEDDLPCTQNYETNENDENCLVGTMNVDNKLYSIVSGVTTIGRHPACKIVLNHETISKTHAEIEAESADKAVFIRDLNSCNKTKINNTKLRPNSSYQIRDGDKLTFGKMTAIFKLLKSVDDSLISCTPQIDRKIRNVIPGTPDSSLNASSASENDVSIVPGTQKDKTDSCFRMPEIPIKNITSEEQSNLCASRFSLDDFPSILSKDNGDEDISEEETQKFIVNDFKEDLENSIYNVATQKAVSKDKDSDSEDIYEMETQRPCEFDVDKDDGSSINDCDNLKTRQSYSKKNSFQRKSMNESIHNAETQKNVGEVTIESLENLETEHFDNENNDNEFVQNKSTDESIYNAPTQKITEVESFENLETQRFDAKKLGFIQRKSMNASIYSAATQKFDLEISTNESLENLETQRFDGVNVDLIQRKSMNESIYSAATQKNEPESVENLETQQLSHRESCSAQRKSLNESIYSAVTQKIEPESIENLEMQHISNRQSCFAQTKSMNESIYSAATQKNELESVENLETQQFNDRQSVLIPQFDKRNSEFLQNKSVNVSTFVNISIESRKSDSNDTKSKDTSTEERKLNNMSECNESENISFHKNVSSAKKTHKHKPNMTLGVSFSESIDDLESEEIDDKNVKAIINESMDTAESKKLKDNSQFSLRVSNVSEDNAILLPTENQLENHDEQNQSQKLIDQSNNHDKSNISLNKDNSNSILESKVSLIKSDGSADEKSMVDDEDDMFCSQNLIEGCPFAFLPDESNIDNDLSNSKENEEDADDNDLNNSKATIAADTIKHQETFEKSNEKSVILDDSETDEEGIFSSNLSKTDKSVNSIDNNNRSETENKEDSETDDEGIFSSHLSKEDKNKSSAENDSEASRIKNNNDVLETDELLSSHSHKIPEKISVNNDEEDAETDEDIFENLCVNKESCKLETSKSTDKKPHIIDTSDENLFDEQQEVNQICNEQINRIHKLEEPKDENVSEINASPQELQNTKIELIKKSVDIKVSDSTSTKSVQQGDENFLTPKLVIPRLKSPLVESVQESDDWHLNLAPTQEMEDSQQCSLRLSAGKLTRDSSNLNELRRNVSIENYEYESSSTQPIGEVETLVSTSSAKRELEEIKITSSKKLKKTRESQSSDVDLNTTIEKSLNEMFDEVQEKPADVSALLTQQLANILESSQTEDNPAGDSNAGLPSPTLSTRSNSRLQNRRKTATLEKSNCSSTERSQVALNDTIERNLNEMFDDNINTTESYESDGLMTQQLTSVLQSQTDEPMQKETSALKRSNRLSLSANINDSKKLIKSRATKSLVSETTKNLRKKKAATEESSSQDESQDNYFANLKSKKKVNVLSSQEEEEEEEEEEGKSLLEACASKDRLLVRRRGTLGFSSKGQAVSSKECVELLESKGRSFTSDSQSDLEEAVRASNALEGKGKKRFSLSLSKSVDLNSSMSSVSEQEVGSQVSTREKKTPGRRSMGRAVRGFNTAHEAVESHELISAASTESDEAEEQRQHEEPRQQQEQVCTPNTRSSTRGEGRARERLAIPMEDSDEEFLRSMPDIKVAGTAECPPTNSQLAAPSDEDAPDVLPAEDLAIRPRWNWYAERRFDLIYKKPAAGARDDLSPEEEEKKEPRVLGMAREAAIEDVLAQFDNAAPAPARRSLRRRTKPAVPQPASDSDTGSLRSASPPGAIAVADLDDDSDDAPCIIPKYVPLEPLSIQLKTRADSEDNDDDDDDDDDDENATDVGDSDEELMQLRRQCQRMLSVRSAYGGKPGKTEPSSPVIGRRKSALLSYPRAARSPATGVDAAKRRQPGSLAKQGFLLQEPASRSGSACSGRTSEKPTRRSSSTLPIVRTKRAVPSTDADDVHHQPNKRIKVADLKLQELSPADRDVDSPVSKRATRAPKALDCYVVSRNSDKEASLISPLLAGDLNQRKNAIANKTDKPVAGKRGKTTTSATRTKTPVDLTSLNSNHSSKENLVMENSNVGSDDRSVQAAPGTRTRRYPNVIDASLVKNSSDEIPDSNDEQSKKKSGRVTRINQKKNAAVKELSQTIKKDLIIPDSDSDTSGKHEFATDKEELMIQKSTSALPDDLDLFINVGTRSRHAKVSKLSDSEKSDQKEVKSNKQTKNQKVKRIKDSKSKTVENSNSSNESIEEKGVDKKNNSTRKKNTQQNISDLSDTNVNKSSRNIRGPNAIDSDVRESNSQESMANARTRSKRRQDDSTDSSSQKSIVTSKSKSKRGQYQTDSNSQESDVTSKTKSKRNEKTVDSIPQQSTTTSKTRSRRGEDITDSNLQESTTTSKDRSKRGQDILNSNSLETVTASKTRNRRRQNNAESSSQESDTSSITRSRHGHNNVESSSQESDSTSKTRSRRIINKDSANFSSQESQISSDEIEKSKPSISRSARTRNHLTDSVSLKIHDVEKNLMSALPDKSNSSRSNTRNRKRLALPDSCDDKHVSSEESQEVAEIIQSSITEEKDSTDTKSNTDSTFEKPASRAKRARLIKPVKEQPVIERNSTDDEELESSIPKRSKSRRARSPKSLSVSTPNVTCRTRRSVTTTPKNGSFFKVLFTGEKSKAHRHIVTSLGGSEVEDPAKCTILVTDKVLRTYKLLCSLSRGIPIVSIKWLEESKKAQHFIDWEDYILSDPVAEAKFKFNLKESLEKASKHKLLEGYTIVLTPKITQPPISELKGMITSSGGKSQVRAPAKWSEKIIVVSKDDDLQSAKKIIAKAPKSTSVHSIELLLTGILRQEIDLKEFILPI